MSINRQEQPYAFQERIQVIALPKKWEQESFTVTFPLPKRELLPSAKMIFDFVVSGAGILFSSPLWLLIGAAILIEDGRPIFYRQGRVGKDGKIFYALKFRTMHENAEEGLGPVQALKNDPRITRIGRILRKTALDELPQLLNILKGEMSFVGPRPLRPGEILANQRGERIQLEDVPGFYERITVTPGLTGLAQVYAPRDIHHRQKFRYDLLYVKTGSFLLDLKLIVMSFLRTFFGRWEA